MGEITFSPLAIDAIGEAMNISLGSSATAVSNMLDHRVDITTPTVQVINAEDFSLGRIEPAIGVEIKYVCGLEGSNIMMLKRSDVKAIVDILLGTETPDEEFQLDELSVSVVCEVMNQMMGAASTALSDLLGRMVNISTPESFELLDLDKVREEHFPVRTGPIVVVSFQLSIEGVVESDLPADYAYTDLELEIYRSLSQDIIPLLGGSWENYLALQIDYERTEVHPTLVQLLGLDEIVVIVDLKIMMTGNEGRMSICLPGTVLSAIFAEISLENPTKKVSGEDNSDEIFDKLRDSSLEIVAQLGDAQLSLSDVFHLNVGDVVDLGRSKDSPIYLEIGGYHWFTGKMGIYKKNVAIRINRRIHGEEDQEEPDGLEDSEEELLLAGDQ